MNKKGFTMVELIAAIAIMLIISIVVTSSISKLTKNNEDKRYDEFKRQIEDAACVYIDLKSSEGVKNNCFKSSTNYTCSTTVDTLINENLISSKLVNPKTGNKVSDSTEKNKTISISWTKLVDTDVTPSVKSCTYSE